MVRLSKSSGMNASCTWDTHVQKRTKNNKIPNEQPAFGCQPALGSHSQSLTNKLFSSFIFVSFMWASHVHDEKGTFLLIFECFLSFSTMQTHVQACVCWSKYTTSLICVLIIFTFICGLISFFDHLRSIFQLSSTTVNITQILSDGAT